MLRTKQDKSGPSVNLNLKVEDEDDAQTIVSTTVAGSAASNAVSQLTSALASPARRGTASSAVADEMRKATTAATTPTPTGTGVSGLEEVPTTTGADDDEDDQVEAEHLGLSATEEPEGTTTPPFPRAAAAQGGRDSPSMEELSLPFGRAWRQRQQPQQKDNVIREATLKPDRAQLGIRHHVVPADATDIRRMAEGRSLVKERARYANRRTQLKDTIRPSTVRTVGVVVYDIHYLRDETELWHRRMDETTRSRGLARMLCC